MKKRLISAWLAAISLSMMTATAGTAFGLEAGSDPLLTVRLYGGLGYPAIGDLNAGLKGFSDSIVYLDTGSYSARGGYSDLRSGIDLGGDLVIHLSPSVGIGFGAGYFRASKTSVLNFTAMHAGLHNEDYTFTPLVSVVPIRASLFVFVPLGRVLTISLNAGPEYYLASVSTLIHDEYPAWWWNERKDEAKGRGFGFHGGIGLEIRLFSGFSLIFEGQGRWAKINELTGSHSYINSFGYEEKENGTLYYWTDLWTFRPFPYVFVNSTLPSDPWQQNPRKAVLDLSGWSAVAGFVIRF